MSRSLVIGSRGSQLALTQSNWVADQLRAAHADLEVRIEVIKTKGDRILDAPLAKIGGKGLFTKELEVALMDDQIDCAVHSLKDLPTELPDGLALGAVPKREDPHDVLICVRYDSIDALPEGAVVGTSSLRRRAQLNARRPDLDIVDLRGNIETRVKRVTDGDVDASLLAQAGLQRLSKTDAITQVIPHEVIVPAPAQGALGIEMRADDPTTEELLQTLGDPVSMSEITAERTCLAKLEGGCQVPLGVLARVDGEKLWMIARVCSLDGKTVVETTLEGAVADARALGCSIAETLLGQGAAEIIAAAR